MKEPAAEPAAVAGVDRQAWANLVVELIRTETGGKKAPFARLVGVSDRSLSNWLTGSVEVSESSIRQVAEKLGRDAMELLVAVGYYRAEQVVGRPDPPIDHDAAIRTVREATNLPPHMKERIIAELRRVQREDEERRMKLAEFLIDHERSRSA